MCVCVCVCVFVCLFVCVCVFVVCGCCGGGGGCCCCGGAGNNHLPTEEDVCGLNLTPVSLISKLLSCERFQLSVREVGEHFLHDFQRRQAGSNRLRGAPDCEGESSPVLPGQVPQLLSEVRVPRAGAVAAVNILRSGEAQAAGEEQQSSQEAEHSHYLSSLKWW